MNDSRGMVNSFNGRVESGHLVLVNRQALLDYVNRLPDCSVTLIVERWHQKRSLPQNGYYFGVIVSMMADETGYSKPECHEILKAQCIPPKWKQIGDVWVELKRSSTELTTVEFTEFIENSRQSLNETIGLTTPSPSYGGVT